jgi:hypothetical protein
VRKTEEELRELNDPWINCFLDEQRRMLSIMDTDRVVFLAESFGRPGSQTERGRNYKAVSLELQVLNYKFLLYALHKGYVALEELDFSEFDKQPPKREKVHG